MNAIMTTLVGAGFPRPDTMGGVSTPLPFLAASHDSGLGEVVIIVIAVFVWLISQISKAAKKQQQRPPLPPLPQIPPPTPPTSTQPLPTGTMNEQLRQRRMAAERHREQIRQQLERARNMAQRKPAPARPSPAPPRQAQPAARRPVPTPAPRRTPAPTRAAFLQSPQKPQQPEQPLSPVPVTQPAAPMSPTRAAPSTTAVLLHRWLNPRTLRSQFILTEIFQPPLGLREPRV